MISHPSIQAYAQQVGQQCNAEQVILFGSYVTLTCTEHSDVDLLVLMDFEGRGFPQVLKILKALPAPFPTDLLVKRPADAHKSYQEYCPFMRAAFDRGEVLYERNRSALAA